ncbi:hypothetical protein QTP86_019809 [Hemibagrus guttatus]|nr:hypothetical protein QTP86_019809 [Hemibagrus guttatus]
MHSSNRIIKFADDMTMVGLISKNESAHREEVQRLTARCKANSLSLNVDKTRDENFNWSLNITSISKKAQQHLYFLRRLRKAHLPPPILTMFYRGTIESILSSCITAWFGNCTVSDRKILQRIARTTEIIDVSLPSITDIQTPNSTIAKTKELSKDTRNKIVDLPQAGKTESAIGKNLFYPLFHQLLKFADDTTVISLIQDSDESAYRQEVEQMAAGLLWQLRKFNLLQELLMQFYSAVTESVLCTSIAVWFGSATNSDIRMVQTAERIIGAHLPTLQELYTSRGINYYYFLQLLVLLGQARSFHQGDFLSLGPLLLIHGKTRCVMCRHTASHVMETGDAVKQQWKTGTQ